MPNDLRAHLQDLAAAFADGVLAALRSASLAELAAEHAAPRAQGGRRTRTSSRANGVSKTATPAAPAPARSKGPLPRRTPEQVAKTLELVLAVLRRGTAMRAEELQKALGVDKREMPRVLQLGLGTKKIARKGERRATSYSLAR